MKTSELLSISYNDQTIGVHGGTSVNQDLVKPGDNQIRKEHIEAADKAINKERGASWTGWQKDK